MIHLIHTADLHFGRLPIGSPWDPQTRPGPALPNLIPSFAGHNPVATSDLAVWWANFTAQCAAAGHRVGWDFLHGGDLTATGDLDEYDTAEDYVTSALRPIGPQLSWGLSVDSDLQVPGNHDYWGGDPGALLLRSCIKASRTARAAPTVPLRVVTDPEEPAWEVHLAFLNTFSGIDDARFHDYWRQRAAVRPHALERLASSLDAAADDARERGVAFITRVLLLHHPLEQFPAQSSSLVTQDLMRDWCVDQLVGVLLTGHDHVPDLNKVWSDDPRVVERRAGTGTQRSVFPGLVRPGPYWNSFLQHRFRADARVPRVELVSTEWTRWREGHFRRMRRARVDVLVVPL